MPVIFFVQGRVFNAEISREVHYFGRQGGKMVDASLGFAVRQGQKKDIAGLEHIRRNKFQLGALAQVGMLLVNKFTHVRT